MASEFTSPVPEKFAMALLSVTALADTLSRLNVDIDVNSFIDEVNKASERHAPPLTAVLSPEQVNQRKKDFHKATVATLSNAGHLVPAPKESVVMKIPESSLSDAAREKRRKMLAATRAAFNNTNLQFIHGLEIVILAEDDSNQQVFSEWCLWDTGAQITIIPGGRLTDAVKGGPSAPDMGFLQAEILFHGVQGLRISTTIRYKPQLPNNTQHIILGRAFIECIEYSSTPKVFHPEITEDTAYGTMQLTRYYNPVDGTEMMFN